MTLAALSRFITDKRYRASIIAHVTRADTEELVRRFGVSGWGPDC